MFDPLTALAALAPIVVEAGKAAVQRWIAPDQIKPTSVEDYAKIKNIDLEWFKALTGADAGGDTYRWVEAVRKLQRPFVVIAVLGTWAYAHAAGIAETNAIDNMASIVGFYLFGERTMFYATRGNYGR